MMQEVDALNMNVSDHFNGYGMMDGKIIPRNWGNMIWSGINWIRQILFQEDFIL